MTMNMDTASQAYSILRYWISSRQTIVTIGLISFRFEIVVPSETRTFGRYRDSRLHIPGSAELHPEQGLNGKSCDFLLHATRLSVQNPLLFARRTVATR